MAEYITSREKGASVEVAMLDAARVTTNFNAGGDVTKFLNRNGFTFLNASVQGAMQQARNIREAKMNGLKGIVHLATKAMLAGVPFYVISNLLWQGDKDYEELSDYVKDNYYVVGKLEDGTFVRIPKGRMIAVVQNAFTQVIDQLTGKDDIDLGRFLNLAVENIAPNNPLDNNIIAPIIQVSTGKTWFGGDMVPQRLQDLPAGEQSDESTDAVSKWLGEKLDISPKKINYILDQYSGGVGDVLLPMITPKAENGSTSAAGKIIAPLKSKFTTDAVLNNQNVTDFSDKLEELTKNAKSVKATAEDIIKYKYMNSVNADISELYTKKRKIQNGDMPDDKKYLAVHDTQKQIVDLSRKALASCDKAQVDGDFATIGDRQYRLTNKDEWTRVTDSEKEKQETVSKGLGISAADYWYNVSNLFEDKAAYAASITEISNIKSDRDDSGDVVSGSRKNKVLEYINGLEVPYEEKIILYKATYPSDNTYNLEIIDYINKRDDISYGKKMSILYDIGFGLDKDGNISW